MEDVNVLVYLEQVLFNAKCLAFEYHGCTSDSQQVHNREFLACNLSKRLVNFSYCQNFCLVKTCAIIFSSLLHVFPLFAEINLQSFHYFKQIIKDHTNIHYTPIV